MICLREILADDGVMYLHLDERMNHYLRVVMDEVFGRENFQNGIVWRRTYAHSDANRFGQVHDYILMYRKSTKNVFNKQYRPHSDSYIKSHYGQVDDDGRRYRLVTLSAAGPGPARCFGDKVFEPPKGRHWAWSQDKIDEGLRTGKIVFAKTGQPNIKQYLDEVQGTVVQSIWDDIPPVNPVSPELLGYPTQKPEALLSRIILASSNPGDLIMDVFAGSGTAAAVAEKLGRRWIVCDFGKHAIYTMQKRILKIGESKALGNGKNRQYGKPPKPFCVVSTGAYDFSRIMKLRENRDAYVDFVLGLFQIGCDEKDLSGKYKLTNIFGEKDGDPVEVYPVWNDEYLKNIRIDEDYLKGIIRQSGGKLKGNYYIITPETCTLTGDTSMKNSAGDDVHFKLLKFPYKILEDVSRSFQIQEQPSSQDNVNNLINSTGFYFNDSVEIEVERTKEGLKISRCETKIVDKQGERLKGIEGLAMLLMDVDYDGEIFDMDRTVFAGDIGADGTIKVAGLTESVAVIAIDKHGNESKPFIIKDNRG